MSEDTPKTVQDWQDLAKRELKGGDPADLVWQTPEGIAVKPLYTAADLEGLETLETGRDGVRQVTIDQPPQGGIESRHHLADG